MKTTFQFSGRADRVRRFDSCSELVGHTENGKAVWAWRDGVFVLEEHSGASTFYVARRVSVNDIATEHDTKPARQALQSLIAMMQGVSNG